MPHLLKALLVARQDSREFQQAMRSQMVQALSKTFGELKFMTSKEVPNGYDDQWRQATTKRPPINLPTHELTAPF
jgi:hypothetical protein